MLRISLAQTPGHTQTSLTGFYWGSFVLQVCCNLIFLVQLFGLIRCFFLYIKVNSQSLPTDDYFLFAFDIFPPCRHSLYYNKVTHREVLGVESIERQTSETNRVKWYILCLMGLRQSCTQSTCGCLHTTSQKIKPVCILA